MKIKKDILSEWRGYLLLITTRVRERDAICLPKIRGVRLAVKMADWACLGLLLLAGLAAPQEISWGGSQYYMGWGGGGSWHYSRDACRARGTGWDLASITTSAENRGLESLLLNACEAEQGDLALCCFYLGGYDISGPNSMSWVTGEPTRLHTQASMCKRTFPTLMQCCSSLKDF